MNPSPFVPAYLMVMGLIGVGLAIPFLMGKVKRNEIFGFRTRLTLSSDEIWYPANHMAGKWILAWGVMNLVLSAAYLTFGPYLLRAFSPHYKTVENVFSMAPVTIIVLMAAGLMIWVERKFGHTRKS